MPSAALEKTYGTTLPAAWYREPAIYELERRAIFSKHWLLVTHKSRFTQAGQYVRFEVAGYPFFLMQDRKGAINGFLNICRHRAFPLMHEDSGVASIISCKYHGWSYGLSGNLAKAPRFDKVSDFDKSEYALFKVHTHIDRLGMVYVNLDSSETPISWDEQYGDMDKHKRFDPFKMDEYVFDHDWTMDANFNWKALMENYNECYHCPTSHPGFAGFLKPDGEFEKKFIKSYIEYYPESSMKDDLDILIAAPTYLFPHATLTISAPFFYMMATVPTSPTTCKMAYQIFRHKDATDKEFTEATEFFKQVEREDKALGTGAQKNLITDTYVAGPLHPKEEDAVYQFHKLLRSNLHEHRDIETKQGAEFWPARRVPRSSNQLDEDMLFCQGVCDASRQAASDETSPLKW